MSSSEQRTGFIRYRLIIGTIALLYCLIWYPRHCVAQDSGAAWHFRYELFQMLVEQNGLRNTMSVNELMSDPEDSVLVWLGDLSNLGPSDWAQIRQYVLDGGAVLMASDRGCGVMGIQAGPVKARNAQARYQGYSDVLEITDIELDHPLASGVNSIIANKSGWLGGWPADRLFNWKTVASLPTDCAPVRCSGQPFLIEARPRDESEGLLILCSDHSVFSNSMLWHGDNAPFVINISNALCAGGRSKVVFAIDGIPQQSFRNSPLLSDPQNQPQQQPNPAQEPKLPKPTPESMLKLGNKVLQEVEESNVLNELLREQPRGANPWAYLRAFLLVITTIGFLWLLWLLLRQTGVIGHLISDRTMKTALEMNAAEHMTPQALGAAAEVLARNLCAELCGSTEPSAWERQLRSSNRLPSGVILNGYHRKGLKWLLELAVDGHRRSLTRREFRRAGRLIEELRALSLQNALRTA
ncbi:MAG: hypothetical protein JNL58_24770 [Planctomyces sp.]|nr:hypothetical protein [Planctomyces sp.]